MQHSAMNLTKMAFQPGFSHMTAALFLHLFKIHYVLGLNSDFCVVFLNFRFHNAHQMPHFHFYLTSPVWLFCIVREFVILNWHAEFIQFKRKSKQHKMNILPLVAVDSKSYSTTNVSAGPRLASENVSLQSI